MADLEKIADELSTLTVIEAADLSKLLEEKWGVSAAAPVAVDADCDAISEIALADENVKRFVADKTIRKTIVVPGRLVNVVV